MIVLDFLVFSGFTGHLLYRHERPTEDIADKLSDVSISGNTDQTSLLFGMLHSLRRFATKISTVTETIQTDQRTDDSSYLDYMDQNPAVSFLSFVTETYKLHFFESPTGYQFVLLTDPDAPNMTEALNHIYSSIFVGYVVRNPLSNARLSDSFPEKKDIAILSVDCYGFRSRLETFFTSK